jgi:hypothetical protein
MKFYYNSQRAEMFILSMRLSCARGNSMEVSTLSETFSLSLSLAWNREGSPFSVERNTGENGSVSHFSEILLLKIDVKFRD